MTAIPNFLDDNGLRPSLLALGEDGLLVRFADRLGDAANLAAIAFATNLVQAGIDGIVEVTPNLVSVLVRYAPARISFSMLAGEVRLHLATLKSHDLQGQHYPVSVRYGDRDGPDLESVARALNLDRNSFVAAHTRAPVRVLSAGFAPGFVYCGLHERALDLPRRPNVRARVPAGSILFAGGLTAITATPIPTGWAVIGQTDFSNFHPAKMPPTTLRPGDTVQFCEADS